MRDPPEIESVLNGLKEAVHNGADPREYFAVDAVFVDASGSENRGYEFVKRHFEALADNRVRFHHHPEKVVVEGDTARIRWRWDAIGPTRVLDAEIIATRQSDRRWLVVVYSPFGHSWPRREQ